MMMMIVLAFTGFLNSENLLSPSLLLLLSGVLVRVKDKVLHDDPFPSC